jgi:hypothetical protein
MDVLGLSWEFVHYPLMEVGMELKRTSTTPDT